MKSITVILALTLSGCATCSKYPVACAAAGAIVVGSIAATAYTAHNDSRRTLEGNCAGLTCGSVIR